MQVNKECQVFLPPPMLRTSCCLFVLDCPNGNPHCRIEYEGTADGLYCYNSQTIVGMRLLYTYLDELVDNGMSGGFVGALACTRTAA